MSARRKNTMTDLTLCTHLILMNSAVGFDDACDVKSYVYHTAMNDG